MMCESMCVGSLKMTFVPEPVVQPKPRERIKARNAYNFHLGDRIMCVIGSALSKGTVYIVTEVDKERMLFCTNGMCANETIPHYDNRFVLESETIIEDGVRVVGYVNDPCPAPKPKTMKFNDVPNWSVFTVDNNQGNPGLELIKINHNSVLYSSDSPSGGRYKPFEFNRKVSPEDNSWNIFNNSANCTIIGSIQFG